MGFVLFLLVNATLFIRPAEVFGLPEFENAYQYLILLCLAVSLVDVLAFFSRKPTNQPIVLCVLGITACVPLAFVLQGNLDEAVRCTTQFIKVLIYFLLLVSLVNSPARVRLFVAALFLFAVGLTSLVLLNYHQVIQLDNVKVLKDRLTRDGFSLEESDTFERLQGTGIFQDPNEMGVILACLVPIGLFGFMNRKGGMGRVLFLAGLGLFAYAIFLTRSRGALLAMAGGMGAFAWARYGPRLALGLAALGLPVLLVVYGGRQMEISVTKGTGSARIEHWSDWMWKFRDSPLVGVGINVPKNEILEPTARELENRELLAHNSFIQAFADLGVVGGMLFFGAFFLALWSVWRLGRGTTIVDPDLRRLQPYVFGCVAAYALGACTLSIGYVVPTYLILGLASAFTTASLCYPPKPLKVEPRLVGRIAFASVGYLAAAYVFVRLFHGGS